MIFAALFPVLPPLLGYSSVGILVLLLLVARWVRKWSQIPGTHLTKDQIHPMRAEHFTSEKVDPSVVWDTIVIGSGSGGCACANLLAQAGQRVLILEQHPDRSGGCTHSFRQQNCEWDTGLHYTSTCMSDATQRAGALLHFMTKGLQKWKQLPDPYDQVVFPTSGDGDSQQPPVYYSFVQGADATIESILKDMDLSTSYLSIDILRDRCEEWMKLCRLINDGFTALGLSRILPPFLHFLLGRRLNQLYKLASYTVRDVQYAVFNLGYTKADLLSVKQCPTAPPGAEPDPVLRRLKAVLTHPIGDYAVQPRDATFAAHGITMAHYMEGASYTVGPTQNISIRSTSVVRALRGEIWVDATVKEIILDEKTGRAIGVKVQSTSQLAEWKKFCEEGKEVPPPAEVEIRARKAVVCATGVYNLYNKLLPPQHPVVQSFQQCPSQRSIEPSNGHIFLFCKIKGDAATLKLPEHNVWYFNDDDMDGAFDRYFANPTEHRPPTVYIGFPCTKDPTWPQRFPGVSNCILISDGLWEWFTPWENKPVHLRGSEYEAFKEKLARHLLDILLESVPQLSMDQIEYWTLGTPLSEVTYLSSYHGGSYGTKCTPEMFATINRGWTTNPRTSIPGLFVAGSDAFLPAVCGAMYGGCLGASAVLGWTGSLRLFLGFWNYYATIILEESPKLSKWQAYRLAFRRFVSD
ncbi:all-trans-retinol 13,14-reductase [Fistulifera solaris]|uniref:All-trans-retinol 13,14-reductase n=1 Tax=Fistulifera solaris TaxID=1519565 RepID=A0A1Z5KP84_FISSO|nr:all-trans-retinol 13,14-reductase [Fistulifera solaris]|eukprot:GAX27935.1 all-trans-retinol 13,14-reductase [Fistulifera solaris]